MHPDWQQGDVGDRRADVLVVEDDPFDRRRFIRVAEQSHLPMRISFAGTLAEARLLLGARRFDAVVLDNGLPDGRGVDLAAALVMAAGATPVVLVSGFPTPFMVDKARAAGVRAVYTKDELDIRILRRLLGQMRSGSA